MSIDALREVFHAIAAALVWPVLLGLIGLAAAMLVAVGAFARELWDRRRGRGRSLGHDRAALDTAALRREELDVRLEEILQAAERRRWRSLGRLRLAVRVGPSLGLMGTLIPMADALQGLAEGDLPSLASNMVTAFAATVIGLSISVIAYVIAAIREDWARADTDALAFHAERVSGGKTVAGTTEGLALSEHGGGAPAAMRVEGTVS